MEAPLRLLIIGLVVVVVLALVLVILSQPSPSGPLGGGPQVLSPQNQPQTQPQASESIGAPSLTIAYTEGILSKHNIGDKILDYSLKDISMSNEATKKAVTYYSPGNCTFEWQPVECPSKDEVFDVISYHFVAPPAEGKVYSPSLYFIFENTKSCLSGPTITFKGKKACVIEALAYNYDIQLEDNIALRITLDTDRKSDIDSALAALSL